MLRREESMKHTEQKEVRIEDRKEERAMKRETENDAG